MEVTFHPCAEGFPLGGHRYSKTIFADISFKPSEIPQERKGYFLSGLKICSLGLRLCCNHLSGNRSKDLPLPRSFCGCNFTSGLLKKFLSFNIAQVFSLILNPHLVMASLEVMASPEAWPCCISQGLEGLIKRVSYSLEPYSLMDHAWCFYFYFGGAGLSYNTMTNIAGHQWVI